MCIISLLSICISCTLNIKQSTGNCRGNSNKAQRDGSCIRLLLLFQKLDLKIFGIKSVKVFEYQNSSTFCCQMKWPHWQLWQPLKWLLCFVLKSQSIHVKHEYFCYWFNVLSINIFFSGGAYSLSEQIIIIDCPFCKFAMYVPFQRDYCAIFHIWDIFCKLIYDSLKKKKLWLLSFTKLYLSFWISAM